MSVTVSAPHLERHPGFQSRFLGRNRDVVVYLPPGYAGDRARRYPVLYMHDGQNLFHPDTSFVPGEYWRMGEMADMLIAEGRLLPLVIVGVNHTGTGRVHEYTPTIDPRLGGGLGAQYGRLLTEELKPFIDQRYRTLPDRRHTGLGGSSLGGLSTMFLGLRHADVFSRLAVLSPSVWWGRRAILRHVTRTRPKPDTRIWLDIGADEGKAAVSDARRLLTAIEAVGWRQNHDLAYSEPAGATHNERAWGERIGNVLEYLYPTDMGGWHF